MNIDHKNKLKSSVQAEFATIEGSQKKNKELIAGTDEVFDNQCYLDAHTKWETNGKLGDEPKREHFNGAWQKLLNEARIKQNENMTAFEVEVKKGLKNFKPTVF